MREEGFTGCKKVCGEGGCGACTVIVSHWDDLKKEIKHESKVSCLLPLASLNRTQIITIEGLCLLSDNETHPVSEAFSQMGASQCGFCTPGFILALTAELENKIAPKKSDLEKIFDGNLCRCTGYRPIMDAASFFCEDPLLDSNLSSDGSDWKKKLKNCRQLSSLFPKQFQRPPATQIFQSPTTAWAQPSGLPDLFKLMETDFGSPLESSKNSECLLVSGNTDLGYRESVEFRNPKKRIYLNQVQELGQVTWSEAGLQIGGAVTVRQLVDEIEEFSSNLKGQIPDSIQALKDQCRHFANNQVRNMATLGGGLMNWSSYSDLIPVWIATKSVVKIVRQGVEQSLQLSELFDEEGNFLFRPQKDDLLVSFYVPFSQENEIVQSFKYARRRLDSITFLSACLSLTYNPSLDRINEAIICFDGLGVTGLRIRKVEALLQKGTWTPGLQNKMFSSIEEELKRLNQSPLPKHLKNYQIRLAKGILVRLYSQFRKRFFEEVAHTDQSLLDRYPQVAHRAHLSFENNSLGILGKAIPHINAKNQTTGKAKYTADVETVNCTYGALVTSPVARGRILSIDPSVALAHPDVIGFYSAKDIPGLNRFGFRVEDEEVLASEELGYIGQPVGILVAKSEEVARKCALQVVVHFEKLQPILSFEDAISKKSTHGRPEGYLVFQGDLEEGFRESHLIVQGEVSLSGQSHFYLEPQSALVIPREDGFQVHSSTQSPSNVVDHISRLLGISKNEISVEVGRLGGGFGGKQLRAGPIAAISALAASSLKRPVKLSLHRSEDMAFCPGRSPAFARYRAGFHENGEISAVEIDFYLNGGYTSDYSADITETATLLMDSCYRLKNVKVRGTCLKMNYGSFTSTRGFGKPQCSAIIETIIDHGASSLNIDPTQVRTRNLYKKGDLTITKTELRDDVVSKCWSRLLEKSNYAELCDEISQFNQENKWVKRGVAAVSSKGNMGFIESDDINRGLCVVQIFRDGTLSLNHSGCEMGQGINTRMAQVAAHHLEVPLESIVVTDTQSSLIPNTPPTTMVASDLIGRALILACRELKEKLSPYSGNFCEKVTQAYVDGVSLLANGIYTAPRLTYDYEKQEGDISYFFVWGSALSVVEVDLVSGNFRILQSKVVQDCGKSLNPHLDIGQAEGGFLFGVGYYTMENMIYSDEGKLITDNVSSYKVPSCGDVPLDWDIELLNYTPQGEGLHNSKGIGEANTQLGMSVYFAIKNAIRAARVQAKMDPVFQLSFPSSVENVSTCLPKIEEIQ